MEGIQRVARSSKKAAHLAGVPKSATPRRGAGTQQLPSHGWQNEGLLDRLGVGDL